MARELIITERCMGLYKDDSGKVQHCEHAIGHTPECGPDSIARPYVEPTEQPEQQPAPVSAQPVAAPASPMFSAHVVEWLGNVNSNPFHGIGPVMAATIFTFAALVDSGRAQVSDEEIARVLRKAPSTMRRHLRERPDIAEYIGRGWFRPVTPVVHVKK